ncbi:plexin-B-like [Ptychodera flava]|uniref:plexin-B-like n=1 Tax=Ptychodera flava TaxID=63121 RepID=UPI00396A3817
MVCISPPVELSRVKVDRQVLVGFIMDAVVLQPDLDFKFKDDPVYYMFTEEGNVRDYIGGQLVIEGENLNLASVAREVSVTIGKDECKVVSLSDIQLNCVPPESLPRGLNDTGNPTENGLPEVRIEVGNLRFFVGYLKYTTVEMHTILGVNVGLAAALAISLVIVIIMTIALCYLRNKTFGSGIGKAENRLEMMEMDNRKRQAMVLPFLDFFNYTANMICDGQADNPVLNKHLPSNADRMKSLEKFSTMLVRESFCLVLIRTLEDQKKMTADHKATVGCLLTIILHRERHMLYMTELLKNLMAEVAVKAHRTKKAKSMLKRYDDFMFFFGKNAKCTLNAPSCEDRVNK